MSNNYHRRRAHSSGCCLLLTTALPRAAAVRGQHRGAAGRRDTQRSIRVGHAALPGVSFLRCGPGAAAAALTSQRRSALPGHPWPAAATGSRDCQAIAEAAGEPKTGGDMPACVGSWWFLVLKSWSRPSRSCSPCSHCSQCSPCSPCAAPLFTPGRPCSLRRDDRRARSQARAQRADRRHRGLERAQGPVQDGAGPGESSRAASEERHAAIR